MDRRLRKLKELGMVERAIELRAVSPSETLRMVFDMSDFFQKIREQNAEY